jgi:hypothetical protein
MENLKTKMQKEIDFSFSFCDKEENIVETNQQ